MADLRSTTVRAWTALVGLFAFRLLFGLSSDFFFEDQTQVFLLGLRYYATGHWPYFGADVVWTKSEIPGALQALLVGLPLRIAPLPEAPVVLLNIVSMASLVAYAWYLSVRFPTVPRWLLFGWLLTIPWTIQFSTNVINTSYILPASLVFFIGFFEATPAFRAGVVPVAGAHVMMGAAIGWLAQIHMSWPLLVPLAGFAWASGFFISDCGLRIAESIHNQPALHSPAIHNQSEIRNPQSAMTNAAAFLSGVAIFAVFLLPTWWRYGLRAGDGGTLRNFQFHVVNPMVLLTTLARLLSFASLEINRFLGTDGAKRLAFFQRHLWLAPLAGAVWIAGVLQPLWMLVEVIRRRRSGAVWLGIRLLLAACVVLVYLSYGFVIEPPQAHAFYVLAPVSFFLAACCWPFVDSPHARRVAAVLLALNVAFHAGLAWAQAPEKSLYKNREPVAAAVREKQPEMFAHRRPFAIGGGPLSLQDPSRPYNPVTDIEVLAADYRVGFRGSTDWTVTIRNRNPRVAFRDLLYFADYRRADGAVLEERHEVIKDIFEPGAVRTLEINDGFVRRQFDGATFRIAAAEALMPDRP